MATVAMKSSASCPTSNSLGTPARVQEEQRDGGQQQHCDDVDDEGATIPVVDNRKEEMAVGGGSMGGIIGVDDDDGSCGVSGDITPTRNNVRTTDEVVVDVIPVSELFLTAEERYEILMVKLAERPHLAMDTTAARAEAGGVGSLETGGAAISVSPGCVAENTAAATEEEECNFCRAAVEGVGGGGHSNGHEGGRNGPGEVMIMDEKKDEDGGTSSSAQFCCQAETTPDHRATVDNCDADQCQDRDGRVDGDCSECSEDDEDGDAMSDAPPLIDGCDLPLWRGEGLALKLPRRRPGPSPALIPPECQSVCNIGTSSTLFRRESQWPGMLLTSRQRHQLKLLGKEESGEDVEVGLKQQTDPRIDEGCPASITTRLSGSSCHQLSPLWEDGKETKMAKATVWDRMQIRFMECTNIPSERQAPRMEYEHACELVEVVMGRDKDMDTCGIGNGDVNGDGGGTSYDVDASDIDYGDGVADGTAGGCASPADNDRKWGSETMTKRATLVTRFVRDYEIRNYPVVITNATEGWKAMPSSPSRRQRSMSSLSPPLISSTRQTRDDTSSLSPSTNHRRCCRYDHCEGAGTATADLAPGSYFPCSTSNNADGDEEEKKGGIETAHGGVISTLTSGSCSCSNRTRPYRDGVPRQEEDDSGGEDRENDLSWTFNNLLLRFGNDVMWRFSDTHGEMMSLHTYAKYTKSVDGGLLDDSPLAIYDSEFGDVGSSSRTSVLTREYHVPRCFSGDLFDLAPSVLGRPPYRWILIGPPRSGTGMHVDPLHTDAWVTVLEGCKRWVLFPPCTPPDRIGMLSGSPQIPSSIWFRDYYDKTAASPTWPSTWRPVEVLQRPGETVYVPSGWAHLVLNLERTVAVTHNYASEYGPNFERMWDECRVDADPTFLSEWYDALLRERPDLAHRISRHGPERKGRSMR